MRHNNRLRVKAVPLTLIASALLLCLGCREYRARHSTKWYGDSFPDEETLLYRHCRQDADCVYVVNGCCECGLGMEELSVNKALKPAFERRMKRECAKGSVCPDGSFFPDCGTGGNICKEGICTYIGSGWDSTQQKIFWEYPQGVWHYSDRQVHRYETSD